MNRTSRRTNSSADSAMTAPPADPKTEGHWTRPSASFPAVPRWGHAHGIQVGLHPLPGPRGLIRVYAPYLGDRHRQRVLNFIAIEPIVSGDTARGFSELEPSSLDDVRGKRFWSAETLDDVTPKDSVRPCRGLVTTVDGVERLSLFVVSEPFDNGAQVAVEITFRADRPHEVGVAASTLAGSARLDHCVLTATMGNFARLRRLHLADEVATPLRLWPDFEGPDFSEHAAFGVDRLARNAAGEVEVSATPDEAEPSLATYGDDVAEHWKYSGARARQVWTAADPDPSLEVLVNARAAYWASTAAIPGGPSFENFELKERFREGRQLRFAIEPLD
jgi:hypothetical protein